MPTACDVTITAIRSRLTQVRSPQHFALQALSTALFKKNSCLTGYDFGKVCLYDPLSPYPIQVDYWTAAQQQQTSLLIQQLTSARHVDLTCQPRVANPASDRAHRNRTSRTPLVTGSIFRTCTCEGEFRIVGMQVCGSGMRHASTRVGHLSAIWRPRGDLGFSGIF